MQTFKHCRLRTGKMLCLCLPASVQTPKGKKDALKATAPQSNYYKQNVKTTVSIPNKWPDGYLKKISKTYMQRQYNDRNSKPQQKHRLGTDSKTLLGEGFNRFYVATTLALSSVVVYTRHLFSPSEGFLTHQCYIFENIKIKRIQK